MCFAKILLIYFAKAVFFDKPAIDSGTVLCYDGYTFFESVVGNEDFCMMSFAILSLVLLGTIGVLLITANSAESHA